MQVAGRLGMSESEFEITTPRYFFNAIRGWEKNEQAAWERARLIALNTRVPRANGREIEKVKRALRFPWEGFHLSANAEKDVAAILAEDCRREWGADWKPKHAEA